MNPTLLGLSLTLVSAGSGAWAMHLFARHYWRWLTHSIEYAMWFIAGQGIIAMVMLYFLELAKDAPW